MSTDEVVVVEEEHEAVDCDDAMLLIAAREHRTLTELESTRCASHVSECRACQLVSSSMEEGNWRWVVRVPNAALSDRELLALPSVDPVVFADVKELAVGGMGRIAKVFDRRLGREVALKEVLGEGLRARFEREVKITSRLQHPAIVPIYEAGTFPDGAAFYTMRLVDGGTLQDAINRAPDFRARLALLPHVFAVADALAYAHERRVIHRDLKPGNVLVGRFGETLVIDWGLAKQVDDDDDDDDVNARTTMVHADLTMAGSVLGTPGFMSPDQAAGRPVDTSDDVYALGAMLYHLIAGQPPHFVDGPFDADAVIAATLAGPPTPLGALAPHAPRDLIAIVERAMSRIKTERYVSAQELASELHRFETGQLLVSRTYSRVELLARWLHRHRTAAVVGVCAALVVIVVIVVAFVNVSRAERSEHTARVVAEQARDTSEATLLALLEEEARVHMLFHDSERALALLSEAYRRGRSTTALRYLLAAATRDLDLVRATFTVETAGAPERAFHDDDTLVTYGDEVDVHGEALLQIWRGGRAVDTHRIERFAAARLTPDARTLVGVTESGTIVAWDVASNTARWRTTGVAGVDLATDGRVVLTTRRDRSELRDVQTGRLLASSADDLTGWVAFGDAAIATSNADGVRVVDRNTLRPIASRRGTWDRSPLAFASSDSLVVGRGDGADFWDLRTNTVSPRFTGHVGLVNLVAVSADRVATSDATGLVRLWTVDGTLLGESREIHGELRELRFSPGGDVLAGAGIEARTMFWNAAMGVLGRVGTSELREHTARDMLLWSPTGAVLLDDNRAFNLIAPPTGNFVKRIAQVSGATARVAVAATGIGEAATTSEDGATSYVARDGKVFAHTSSRPPRLVTAALPPNAERLVLAARGRALVAIGGSGVALVDLATGATRLFPAEANSLPQLTSVWTDDAASTLIIRGATTASVWNVAATTSFTIDGISQSVTDTIAIRPDGALVAAASDDGTVRIWDVASARLVDAIHGHSRAIETVAFSADGHRLVVSDGQTTTLWNMALETRSPADIARIAARYSRYAFVNQQLVEAEGSQESTPPRRAVE